MNWAEDRLLLLGATLVPVGLVLLYIGSEALFHDSEPLADEIPVRRFLRRTRTRRPFGSWSAADLSLRGVRSMVIGAIAVLVGAVSILRAIL